MREEWSRCREKEYKEARRNERAKESWREGKYGEERLRKDGRNT